MFLRPVVVLLCLCPASAAFGQTAPAPATTPLTIGAAIAEALEASPALQAQRARVTGERVAAPLAAPLPNPTLSWLGQGLHPDPPSELQPDHGVFLVQSLPLGGRRGAERRLAHADVDVAAAVLDEQRSAVALQTVERFMDAARTRQVLAVIEQRLRGLEELVRIQERRVEEGTSPAGDLGRLQAEQVRVSITARRADTDDRRARLALCAALGRVACGDVEVDTPPTGASAVSPADPLLIDARVDEHPAVRSALSRLEQARFAKAVADASVWPSLEVTAGYTRTQFLDTGMAGLSLSMPLFDRQKAPRARADAAWQAAALDVEQARREVRTTLLQAVAVARGLAGAASSADLQAPALVAQRAARSAFREGDGDLLRLLDAERLVAEAELDALNLTLDALQASLQARVLLGLPLP